MVMEQERRTKTGQQKSEDSESEAKSFIVLSVRSDTLYAILSTILSNMLLKVGRIVAYTDGDYFHFIAHMFRNLAD
jgi:hypothetical protein